MDTFYNSLVPFRLYILLTYFLLLAKDLVFLLGCCSNLWIKHSSSVGHCLLCHTQVLSIVYFASWTEPGMFTSVGPVPGQRGPDLGLLCSDFVPCLSLLTQYPTIDLTILTPRLILCAPDDTPPCSSLSPRVCFHSLCVFHEHDLPCILMPQNIKHISPLRGPALMDEMGRAGAR